MRRRCGRSPIRCCRQSVGADDGLGGRDPLRGHAGADAPGRAGGDGDDCDERLAFLGIRRSTNVGVSGYNLFLNGGKVGSTSATSFTFQGLVCGTSYTLGVEAADAAGNVSVRATKSAAKLPSSGQASSGPSRIRTPDRR